ncbi:hypothetical protein APHAL10511_008328 [Amanita phalloides]|nr:hypothetical protein APHAL10511_008328 [Amanita phalloides]
MYATDTLPRQLARFGFSDHFSSHDGFRSSDSQGQSPVLAQAMNGSSSFDKLDREQRLSVQLEASTKSPSLSSSTAVLPLSTPLVPVPASPPVALPSSPAAQFLSAFCSPPMPQAPLPDAEGQQVAGYTLGSVIGYGGFSTIRRAFSTSGGIVAVKIVRRSDISKQANANQAKKRLDHETTVWSSLSHEHILPLFSAIHTSYADFFITLYCPAGSLFDILKRDGRPALPHDDAGMMFRQVVRGLRYMHEVAAYVHRDMKLENVLVDEMGVCRIGDFGLSRKIGEIDEEDEEEQIPLSSIGGIHRAASVALPASRRLAIHSVARHSSVRHRNSTSSPHPKVFNPGSLQYAAPELLLPRTVALAPHPRQDIWALGVMLYTLLIGRLPFFDSYEPRLQMKITDGVYELPADIGRGAQRVLEGCLERNVADRWTIAMVDELAWGVGWGSEGDDVTEEEAEAEEVAPLQSGRPSRSCSRTRSCPTGEPFDPENPSVEESPRPHQEAASRRSASRLQRSLSRAPALSGRSPTVRSRHHSRSSSPHGSTIQSSDTLSGSSYYSESALIVSPPTSPERGRRQTKMSYLPSRSPSPSVVPTTPIDGGIRYHSLMGLAESSKHEPSPRRRSRSRGLRKFQSHFMPDDAPIPETDVLEDRVIDWQSTSLKRDDGDFLTRGRSFASFAEPLHDYSQSRSRQREDFTDLRLSEEEPTRRKTNLSIGKRGESTPPASRYAALTSWPILENRGRKPLASVVTTSEERFLTPVTVTTTRPTVLSRKMPVQVARSKSVGHERHEQELYTIRQRQPLLVEPIVR